MGAYIHQVDAIYEFSAKKTGENDSYKKVDFIEAKIVILAPFSHHISIFSLIMVLKKLGPFHSYIRPWIGANNQDFFGRRLTPFNGNHSAIILRQCFHSSH